MKPTNAMTNAACLKIEELDDQQTHWWDVVEAALQAALDVMSADPVEGFLWCDNARDVFPDNHKTQEVLLPCPGPHYQLYHEGN